MKQWFSPILAAIFLFHNPVTINAETYSFAVAANTIDTVVSEVIIKRAYEMLGHQISIIRLPPKRALEDAHAGLYDGDVQRIFSVAETYPNLIRIEPPINFIHGTGFILKNSHIQAKSWEDLKQYKVGIILGIRFAETNVPKENSFVYYSYEKLTEALNAGKIDIGIYPESNGIYQALLLGEENIIPLQSPLARFDLYHYIHEKNLHLKSELIRIFEQFQKEGRINAVRQHVLKISYERAKKGLQPCFGDYVCYQGVWAK